MEGSNACFDDSYQNFQNQKAKRICVYQKRCGIVIYHNFLDGEFVNQTDFQEINLNTTEYAEVVDSDPEWQTRVYFTNGSYTESMDGIFEHDKIQQIALTPKGFSTIAGSFYRKTMMRDYQGRNFAYLQNQLSKTRNNQDFQDICDLIYYLALAEKGIASKVKGKQGISVSVGINHVVSQLQRIPGLTYLGTNNYVLRQHGLEDALHELAKQFIIGWSNGPGEVYTNPIICLCMNLIFEIRFVWCIQGELVFPKSYEDAINQINGMLQSAPENTPCEEIEYYKNARLEITKIKEFLDSCPKAVNLVPDTDTAYRFEYDISSQKEPDIFYTFCSLIDEFARNRTSFVLKHIRIKEAPMSSGERALQNLFSWLNMLPQYESYISARSIPIHDNILLLFDELDLYMHPEWQRLSLIELTNNLRIQYPNHQIQIILSTHSPLVLSDIPLSSTIYLAKNGNNLQFSEAKHHETFASNIHDILNNGFFLSYTMGEFAYQKLRQAIHDLQDLRNNPENEQLRNQCQQYKYIIDIVGDPVLKRKLEMLYNTYVTQDEAVQVKQYLRNIQNIPDRLRSNSSSSQEKEQIRTALRQALEALEGTS